MADSYISNLSESLKMLVEKIDQILQDRPLNAENETHLISGLDRLVEVINHIEKQQKVEFWLADNFEETVTRLNKVLKTQKLVAGDKKEDFVENIERIARNVKIVGQAAEFIAESMLVISKAYRQSRAATTNSDKGDTEGDKVDLTGILTQLNNLIKTKIKANNYEGDKLISPS